MPRVNASFTSRVRNPDGATLLDYLSRRFDYHSREVWSELLAKGRLELEGRPAGAGDALREGQRLLFHVVDYDEPEVPLDFSILRREGDLALVHKPAGMPVHRTGRIFFNTLANLVKTGLGDGAWSPLNRLDRETSGIVAFARGPEAFKALAPDSVAVRWTKLYAAVVRGVLPEPGIGRIDQPLGELPGDAIRARMHVHAGGKRAVTLYRTLAEQAGYSLVVLSPITGRKHQLRAHLAWAGCPVVGDKMYSGEGHAYLTRTQRELTEADYRALGAQRQQLHAFYLSIAQVDTPAPMVGGSLPPGPLSASVSASRTVAALDLAAGSLEDGVFSPETIRAWWEGPEGRVFLESVDSNR